MSKHANWIAFVALVVFVVWRLAKKTRSREVWETTPGGPYEVTVTGEAITCTHPKRPTETIPIDDIEEIGLVTTSEGPMQPDMWYIFLGNGKGCSVPSEAKGFDQLWDLFEARFPGFNYGGIIKAGTSDAQTVLWKKASNAPTE